MYCNKVDEMIISNQNEWNSFYNTCVEKNNFNILCVGPRGSGKSTILQHVMNEWIQKDDKLQKEKSIYYYNIHKDSQFHNMITFCKGNQYGDKIVYIEYFHEFSDTNQQMLKALIDQFHYYKKKNKVHFLIETTSSNHVKHFIQKRMQCFETIPHDYPCLLRFFIKQCQEKGICCDESVFECIRQQKSMTFTGILRFIQKLELLKVQSIDSQTFMKHYQIADMRIFSIFFQKIKENEIKDATNILYMMHDNGYDFSDILFFIYQFVKQHQDYFHIIEVVCFYMNHYYNGHNHKVFICFLVHDIKKKYISID
tara:strand:- start:1127 stop:2059 length:933 start_codon:yes stop_codon:yes gene_type:complete